MNYAKKLDGIGDAVSSIRLGIDVWIRYRTASHGKLWYRHT